MSLRAYQGRTTAAPMRSRDDGCAGGRGEERASAGLVPMPGAFGGCDDAGGAFPATHRTRFQARGAAANRRRLLARQRDLVAVLAQPRLVAEWRAGDREAGWTLAEAREELARVERALARIAEAA